MGNLVSRIRNFAIIAHIDHGKSTLADRLIQLTGGLREHEIGEQVLDSMDIEKERGITIKAQTVRLQYEADNGIKYSLNLIDTPGHADFSYEVSRSLSACEGSVLIVDSTQGVEAQTLANVYEAIEHDHEFIIVLNKSDLPAADPEGVKKQIEDVIGLDVTHSYSVSAKTGEGVKDVLKAIVDYLPAPDQGEEDRLQALIIDSWFDNYKGVVVLVRIISGYLCSKSKIIMMGTKSNHIVDQVGIFTPKMQSVGKLCPGEIGYFTAAIKNISDARVGDTITEFLNPVLQPLSDFRETKSVVFCGFYPADTSDYEVLREAMSKLSLNDASFTFEPENSTALGLGFRCGFLGLLHMEIIQERLQREFNIDLIATSPSVTYKVKLTAGKEFSLHNPSDLPDVTRIQTLYEPWVSMSLICPIEYIGPVLRICQERRGIQKDMLNSGNRTVITYELPLSEVVYDFYDKIKSATSGYASLDYQLIDYRQADLVKLTFLVNAELIDALATLVHRSKAEEYGRRVCERLKNLIPKHQFKIPIQAAIGGRIVARETISALRKDVTAKCYGGDITRKRKLLDKQREGKKRMRAFGKVNVPQNAFISILKSDD